MILEFKGENAFLSNFFPCKVTIGLMTFASSEHAFMSFKNDSEYWKKKCQQKDLTPGQIKRLGRKVELVSDWEDIKFGCMKIAVISKFRQNLDLKAKLLATGNQNLVEGNTWNDREWGVCIKSNPNIGENHLGRILMEVRTKLGND